MEWAGVRTCSSCHNSLDLSMFPVDRSRPGGRRYQCKFCRSKQRKSYLSQSGRTNIRKALSDYRANAKRRGYVWELSDEQAISLLSMPCHYCGIKPQSNGKNGIKKNGIDRKDNREGYLPDNCLPCCWKCNKLKGDSSYNEFIALITLIYGRVNNDEGKANKGAPKGSEGGRKEGDKV